MSKFVFNATIDTVLFILTLLATDAILKKLCRGILSNLVAFFAPSSPWLGKGLSLENWLPLMNYIVDFNKRNCVDPNPFYENASSDRISLQR